MHLNISEEEKKANEDITTNTVELDALSPFINFIEGVASGAGTNINNASPFLKSPRRINLTSFNSLASKIATPDLEDTIHDQICTLVSDFPETTTFGLCKDEAGNLKSCCIAAQGFLKGAVMATSARQGLVGILDFLETTFKWGTARCWTLCQCMEQSEIDCGSGMNLSVMALRDSPEVRSNKVSIAKVQIIYRADSFSTQKFKRSYDKYTDYTPQYREYLAKWIQNDCIYHQCVGIVAQDSKLRIWDFGKWLLPPQNPNHEMAILAIRLTSDNDGVILPDVVNWNDLLIPTKKWVTLLPETITDSNIPNVEPTLPILSERQQLEILKKVFDSNHRHRPCHGSSNIPYALSSPLLSGSPVNSSIEALCRPTVLISGTHVGPNPCPGVGVARAIRTRFPNAKILALDSDHDVLSGMMDLTFNQVRAFDGIMMPHIEGEEAKLYWKLVVDSLTKSKDAFYIPCTDNEIDRCSEAMESASPSERERILGRLMCPSSKAVAATEKPQIQGAKDMGLFEIPSFMSFDPKETSQLEIEEFCKHEGYPVIVKGPKQGATLCSSWSQVQKAISSKWGGGGYVQKLVPGFQLGLAYAAFEGELTSAVLMEKTGFNAEAKAWGGRFRPCPVSLLESLRKFCKEYKWTGGGEIEFIEDVVGNWHAIDWNPRFPAWVFAGTYAGVNLPASLIQHALHKQSNGAIPYPESDSLASGHASGGFARTVVETPILNMQQFARSGIIGFLTSDHSKAGAVPNNAAPIDMLPRELKIQQPGSKNKNISETIIVSSNQEPSGSQIRKDDDSKVDYSSTVEDEINRLLPSVPVEELQTPCFLLSRETVRKNLRSHKRALQLAVESLARPLQLQMCLSVKTQPHPIVLSEAKDAGYFPEVITTAEMRACLKAGWTEHDVVVNGPGKWYDTPEGQINKLTSLRTNLRCLFADSLADLVTIVDRVLDEKDWLKADIIGVRLAPCWAVKSRFGIDSKDPKALQLAAEQIRRLPPNQKFGLHMHYASSTVGPTQWFGLAKAFLEVGRGLSDLCGREPVLLDFGGGWPTHLLDSPELLPGMIKMLSRAQTMFGSLKTVQFEPGKSITERAGAIVTKVLEIREMDRKMPKTNYGCADEITVSGSQQHSSCNKSTQKKGKQQHKAVIVDACISDMGSTPTHVHPLLWKKKSSTDWSAVVNGKDEAWGSICMEFDKLGDAISIPDGASPGDHVLIAFCGAYDMTMSYDFADGKERRIIEV